MRMPRHPTDPFPLLACAGVQRWRIHSKGGTADGPEATAPPAALAPSSSGVSGRICVPNPAWATLAALAGLLIVGPHAPYCVCIAGV